MIIAGVFVGGRGRRMGGVDKPLLRTEEGTTILERTLRVVQSLPQVEEIVLLGGPERHLPGFRCLPDAPHCPGPLGGLFALLSLAAAQGKEALAVSGDLPYCSPLLLTRLLAAAPSALAVAPRLQGLWQPLCARYRAPEVHARALAFPADEPRVLRFFESLSPWELPVSAEEEKSLVDWDRPEDLPAELRAQLDSAPAAGS